jgi:hypothetical protein
LQRADAARDSRRLLDEFVQCSAPRTGSEQLISARSDDSSNSPISRMHPSGEKLQREVRDPRERAAVRVMSCEHRAGLMTHSVGDCITICR